MTRARGNRGGKLSEKDNERGKKAYLDWHWFRPSDAGAPEVKMVTWQDEHVPPMLVECGRLIRLHVRVPSAAKKPVHPRRERDTMIEFSQAVSAKSHLAYDADHDHDRLYLLIDASARPALRERFWTQNRMAPVRLNDLAIVAGGRHGKRDYPDVAVKPVGLCTAIVYFTNKKDDGPSYYIHQLGEISHYYPILACDNSGRLWFVGGNYSAPRPGVTD